MKIKFATINPKKLLVLAFVSTFVFATGIEHSHIKITSTASTKGSNDFIFANSFEVGTPPVPTYTSDSI